MITATTRRIFAAGAILALAAACARPVPFETADGPRVAEMIVIAPTDVNIDVSNVEENGDLVAKYLALHTDLLIINEEGGRAALADVRIDQFDLVGNTLRALGAAPSSISGSVGLRDAETGEAIVVPVPIYVDANSIAFSDDFGAITRDRADIKAQKLARVFMKKAHLALFGTTR